MKLHTSNFVFRYWLILAADPLRWLSPIIFTLWSYLLILLLIYVYNALLHMHCVHILVMHKHKKHLCQDHKINTNHL
jgi:hypothetical protein